MAFCKNCGKPIDDGATFCSSCGASQSSQGTTQAAAATSPQKNQSTALVLCFFLGVFGIHDFYCGKTLLGAIKLILTITGFLAIVPLIWEIVDIIKIIKGTYLDGFGRQLNLNAAKSTKIIVIALLVFPVFIIPAVIIFAIVVPIFASGSAAKIKASEMSTAIGSYMNMQEAYIVEMDYPDKFSAIGFSVPESGAFTYLDLANAKKGQAGIAAISLEDLGDCPKGTAFIATATHTPGSSAHKWACAISDNDGNPLDASIEKACEDIAPSFKTICN